MAGKGDRNRTRDEILAKQKARGETIRTAKMIGELPKNDNWRHDPEYMRELIENMLDLCIKNGTIPTQNLMASALGVARDREREVRNGLVPAHPQVVEMLSEYYRLCENTTVQASLDGTVNNISSIFLMKSIYGYQEQPKELVITHNYNKLLGDRKDPEAIAARYAESVVIDVPAEEVREAPAIEEIPDMNGLPPGVVDKTREKVLVNRDGQIVEG